MSKDLKTITILFRAKNSVERYIKEDIKEYGLNPTEFGTLEALYHKKSLTVQAIKEKVLIAPSSMSYVITQLTKRALINKVQDSKDKRVYHVSLTEKGKSLFDAIYSKHVKHLRSKLDYLTPLEEKELQRLLKKLGKQV